MGQVKSLEDLEDAFENGLRAWEEEIVTGNLKKRWFFQIEERDGELVIWISNDVEYAAPVNYGHRIVRGGKTVGKTQGKFMLEKGIQVYQDTYMEQDVMDMLNDLKEAMK